jgi:hypothetical protein
MTETQGWVKRTEVFWFCLLDFGGKMNLEIIIAVLGIINR